MARTRLLARGRRRALYRRLERLLDQISRDDEKIAESNLQNETELPEFAYRATEENAIAALKNRVEVLLLARG